MKSAPLFAALTLAAACGGSSSSTNPDGKLAGDAPASGGDGSVGVDAPPGAKPIIFTIVLENHDYAEIVSKTAGDAAATNAPFINSLIANAQAGTAPYAVLATSYKDTIHPSLGNYLHMISGANQYIGIIDLNPTTFPFPVDQPSLGTQLKAAGVPWRAYEESMGTPCNLSDAAPYAPKHNPWVYFKDMQADMTYCKQVDVDYSNFAADLAADTYKYMWITPNLNSDGHDPATDPVTGLKNSDTWLKGVVKTITDSAGYKAGGVLFITWDEAEGRNGDDKDLIPMLVMSPRLKAGVKTTATAFTHSSYTATIEDLLGLPRLATVTNEATLLEVLNP
jgi:hypothetical protein